MNTICFTIIGIGKENTNITPGIKFIQMFTVIQNVTCSTKDMKVTYNGFLPFPQFIRCLFCARSKIHMIYCATSNGNSFGPKSLGQFLTIKHNTSHFLQYAIFPFNNTILLWCLGWGKFMRNTMLVVKISKNSVSNSLPLSLLILSILPILHFFLTFQFDVQIFKRIKCVRFVS